jgi:hypothetical protein
VPQQEHALVDQLRQLVIRSEKSGGDANYWLTVEGEQVGTIHCNRRAASARYQGGNGALMPIPHLSLESSGIARFNADAVTVSSNASCWRCRALGLSPTGRGQRGGPRHHGTDRCDTGSAASSRSTSAVQLVKPADPTDPGTVKPGKAVLLVSEWNRLTRQVSSDALKFVIGVMEMGIGIIDLQDRAYYTLERYNADTGLQLGLSLKISMSHQYSKNLSQNLKAAWEGRRKPATCSGS